MCMYVRACGWGERSLRQDDGDDHAIEAEGLTEDQNEDHADEDCFLLSVCAHSGVTNNANRESSCLRYD